jgi:hypothetical protein
MELKDLKLIDIRLITPDSFGEIPLLENDNGKKTFTKKQVRNLLNKLVSNLKDSEILVENAFEFGFNVRGENSFIATDDYDQKYIEYTSPKNHLDNYLTNKNFNI